ncbi:MAG: S1 RNA-binding domain-containing protein [Acidimicrobiia bacterium]|nr:S1 RNA-binding domain-containing protein [Acidimicrobiia bacterium]
MEPERTPDHAEPSASDTSAADTNVADTGAADTTATDPASSEAIGADTGPASTDVTDHVVAPVAPAAATTPATTATTEAAASAPGSEAAVSAPGSEAAVSAHEAGVAAPSPATPDAAAVTEAPEATPAVEASAASAPASTDEDPPRAVSAPAAAPAASTPPSTEVDATGDATTSALVADVSEAPPSAAASAPQDSAPAPDVSRPSDTAPAAEAPPSAADPSLPAGAADTPAPSEPATAPVPAERPGASPPPEQAAGPPAPAERPAWLAEAESAGEASPYNSGELVTGKVLVVNPEEVVVSLGERRLGVINKRHLTIDGRGEPDSVTAVGDELEAAVLLREDPQNRVVLSRAWALKQRAWEAVDAATASDQPITGVVSAAVKGGLAVDIGIRAFLPASQVDRHHVDDLKALVGQPIEALITESDRNTDRVVLSRRALLRRQDKARAAEVLAELSVGEVRTGRVVTLTDFGAFVDIDGVRGLLHLSEMSWERVERPADVVSVGQDVEVKVLAVKGAKRRVSLSIRALTADPLDQLSEGQTLTGTVSRLVDFGAFVRVAGIEGLVHISELAEYRVHLPEEVVTPGEEVLVKVLKVDRRRRRVDLSINQAVQY